MSSELGKVDCHTQKGPLAPSHALLVGSARREVSSPGNQAQCSAKAGVGSSVTAE